MVTVRKARALAGKLHHGRGYALPRAKDDCTGFRVITQEPRGQPTTRTWFVVVSEWRVGERTLKSTEEPADAGLSDSENVRGSALSHNKHPANLSSTPILVLVNCQCAMSVVSGEWTL